jgi:hypothetical protein
MCLFWGQGPPRKSEEELREEEELQLALALSKSEAEHKEKEVTTAFIFLISNFCRVLYVVYFVLGNSLASEFYMLTFRNTLFVPFS